MKTINSPRSLFLLGLLTFLLVAVVLVATGVYEHFAPLTKTLPDAGKTMKTHVDPSLTSFEKGEEIQKLKGQSEKKLHAYGWVNKEKGIVHVPIERAMGLYLDQQARKK